MSVACAAVTLESGIRSKVVGEPGREDQGAWKENRKLKEEVKLHLVVDAVQGSRNCKE